MIVEEVWGMFRQKVCEKYDVCLEELRSCSRRNVVVQDRGAMSWIGTEGYDKYLDSIFFTNYNRFKKLNIFSLSSNFSFSFSNQYINISKKLINSGIMSYENRL